jgi:Response regulators consisting of a CheY-like receiver domain and a winged-helix DNA-binding domain
MAHIIIVDDSPTEVHVLKNLLESRGFTTSSASSGEQGIAKAKDEKPDVVLMDVVMPGLNGFQATRQLSKDPDTSNIPVIIISIKSQETDKVWGIRQGAKDYITKPVNPTELLNKIDAVLRSVA